ncbi:MAG: hypothetical protein HY717_15500 [Planctomycetes bacterium]|nr:hypothetical protein [Planctomycetota bacterium]
MMPVVNEWNINPKDFLDAGQPPQPEKPASRVRFCPACGSPFLRGKGARPPDQPEGPEYCQPDCLPGRNYREKQSK